MVFPANSMPPLWTASTAASRAASVSKIAYASGHVLMLFRMSWQVGCKHTEGHSIKVNMLSNATEPPRRQPPDTFRDVSTSAPFSKCKAAHIRHIRCDVASSHHLQLQPTPCGIARSLHSSTCSSSPAWAAASRLACSCSFHLLARLGNG